MPIRISPSLLSANFACLGEEVKALTEAGADCIHVDVMDGHFVPNLTMGPAIVKAIRPYTSLPLDVHLMVQPVDAFILPFIEAGADSITIHAEATTHLHRTLSLIKQQGKKAGIALVPSMGLEVLEYVWELVDMVLLMTVNPGFGGQDFIASQGEKIHRLHAFLAARQSNIEIAVDGGINATTIPTVTRLGATHLVIGSALFQANASYALTLQTLRALAIQA